MNYFAWRYGGSAAPALDESLAEHDKKYHPNGFAPERETCNKRVELAKADKGDVLSPSEGGESDSHKKQQLEIILQTNPMRDDHHTGIRTIKDIKTFEEALENEPPTNPDITGEIVLKAKRTGRITVYSSKAIKNGAFVTPSYMMARDYAGDGTVNSKTVRLEDVAWISGDEGQMAKVK